MQIPKTLFLLCAMIGGAWFVPRHANAQNPPVTFSPLTLATEPPSSHAGLSASPTDAFSLTPPATQPAASDPSLDRPMYACACGCGIFEVGTASMFPRGQGGMLYLEYDYQDQNINWSGVRPAPRSANDDVNIRTNFVTLGVQYFFDRSWGVQVELPYDNRHFETATNAPGGGDANLQWGAFGDLRVQGIYTGFSEDQSIGVSFGAKLPTGNYTHNNPYHDADPDSELGTGTFDLLAGGFFRHQFSGNITGFAQAALDAPIDECQGYRPGLEADAALGGYYTGLEIGGVEIAPVAQLLISERGHDTGPNASHPTASGYQRVLLSPGLEFDFHPFTIYADIEVPVYQHFTGEQLSAPFLMKVILTYHF